MQITGGLAYFFLTDVSFSSDISIDMRLSC